MNVQIIHKGRGKTLAVEIPPPADLTADIPRQPARLRCGVKYRARNPKPWVDPTKAHTGYRPGKLVDLGADQCRFTIVDENHTMCGGKVLPGSSWCSHHHSICHDRGNK